MRLGVFTNSLGRYTPGEVAARVQELGLQAVQLELAFQGEKIRWSELSAGQCREIAAPFQERGIEIAALAGYSNLVDPDENRRQVRVAELVHLLRCARDLGAEMVVTESGGMNERNPWQPDPRNDTEETWGRLRDTVAGLCRVAEEAGSRLLLEPFWAHVVNGPERMRRLRREVGSPALGFVLDPANLVTEQNAAAVGVMLDHLFATLGDDFSLVHTKDAKPGPAGVALLGAGKGILDYARFLGGVQRAGYTGPLIIEHVNERGIPEVRDFLLRIGGSLAGSRGGSLG